MPDVKTTICNLTEARWIHVRRNKPLVTSDKVTNWCFVISANRFLRNMVRSVVGTLVDVGRGRLSLEEFSSYCHNGSRSDAGESMPGNALFLWDIKY